MFFLHNLQKFLATSNLSVEVDSGRQKPQNAECIELFLNASIFTPVGARDVVEKSP